MTTLCAATLIRSRLSVSILIGLLLLPGCGAGLTEEPVSAETRQPTPLRPADGVPGELLIKFKPDVSHERITALLGEVGAEVITVFESLHLYHVRMRSREPIETVIRTLSGLPEVEYAEPNYPRKGFERAP